MQVKTLYRYTREDGGVTVSPNKPEGSYTETYRLIADKGMLLTKEGYKPTPCIDTDNKNGWSEIADTRKKKSAPEAETTETKTTESI